MDSSSLARAASFLQQLVLPVDCAGCGSAGPSLCPDCRLRLAPRLERRTVHGLAVTSALRYEGIVQPVVVAFKNEGRTALGRPLAAALRTAIEHAVGSAQEVVLVPMARTRRSAVERGYDPVRLLLRRAGLPATDVLRLVRRPADQVRLDRAARLANVRGGAVARPAVAGRTVLLVDDVVTTGATLAEAARAVRTAGGTVIGAATLATTPRR